MRDFRRKTKIVATVGPACDDPATLRQLIEAGVDVFRLNFSHGSHADHLARYETIRRMEAEFGRRIGILLDLQGPKLRVGRLLGGGVTLNTGNRFSFDLSEVIGDHDRVGLPHPEVFAAIGPGAELLVDDGRLAFRVLKAGPDFAETEVVEGGRLSDNKGVNLPNIVLPLSPLTEKDRADLAIGLKLGVDWVALSFVQKPEDVEDARQLIGDRAALMAKIEKPSAVEHLDPIVSASDGIMVARGDLGVEMPAEKVPGHQKDIIKACRLAGRPVIVATQMLDSMVAMPSPTRAEASDVATAVYDGADAVMLSAETAAGEYPVEAVAMMSRIIERTEQHGSYRPVINSLGSRDTANIGDTVSCAAGQIADSVNAKAVVCYTTSGSTGWRMAQTRPNVPIVLLTSSEQTAGRATLLWGSRSIHTSDVRSFREMVGKACEKVRDIGLAEPDDVIVVTAGVPFGTPGTTNNIRVAQLEGG